MLKIISGQLLISCLIICCETTRCVEALQGYSLIKFIVTFREARNMMREVLQEHRQKEEETKRRVEEEERRRKEEEQKSMEQLRRKVLEEYLHRKIAGKTTVLKDFFSRF
jgi:hypothetical protein